MAYETYHNVSLVIFILLAVLLFYQSWVNLARHQLTKFCFDALLLLYIRARFGEGASKKTKKLFVQDLSRLQTLGFSALIGGVVFIYKAIDIYLKQVR